MFLFEMKYSLSEYIQLILKCVDETLFCNHSFKNSPIAILKLNRYRNQDHDYRIALEILLMQEVNRFLHNRVEENVISVSQAIFLQSLIRNELKRLGRSDNASP